MPVTRRKFLKTSALSAASLAAGCLSSNRPANRRTPNFILIFCDNLGYGDTQPFGSTLHHTPNLNRMARDGRKFTHFYSTAGVCTPARASIMTGCYAQRIGMHTNPRDGLVLRPVSAYGLNPNETTVAEILRNAGYATACLGKWHLGDQPQFLPTRQGFDWFYGLPYSDDMTERTWQRDGSHWPPLPLMENDRVVEAPCDRDTLTRRLTIRAAQWISQHARQPFFLYFPEAMPGSTPAPFASEAFKGKSKNGPWGDAVEELDWSAGVILDLLEKLGIAQNTLVIWTSDNGAPLAPDPGDLSRGSNLPLGGRAYTTSEGGFRVPMMAWQPGRVPPATQCAELATTMDILPTFAKLAHAQKSPRKTDGYNIAPLLFGAPNAKTPYNAFYYYQEEQLQAVRSGPYKLFMPLPAFTVHPHFTPGQKTQPLLFDVVDDPAESKNLAPKHPEIVQRLTALANKTQKTLDPKNQRPPGHTNKPRPQLLPGAH